MLVDGRFSRDQGAVEDEETVAIHAPRRLVSSTNVESMRNYYALPSPFASMMFDRYQAPELDVSAWYNSSPLTLASLRGKVVVIDFWTYSCINCLRTLPHMKQIWDRYKNLGLVLIGVHSPEFDFEKDANNLEAAIKRHGLGYPIAVDNDFKTWSAFQNNYWPTQYFIDKQGDVRHIHEGEGGEGEIEAWIVRLLRDAGHNVHLPEIKDSVVQYERDMTSEIYAGASRNRGIGNLPVCITDGVCHYSDAPPHQLGVIYLEGYWQNDPHYLKLIKGPGVIILPYQAREVYVVMSSDGPIELEVLMDGKPLLRSQAHQDVTFRNERSYLAVDRDDMYYVVKTHAFEKHDLTLVCQESGFRVYAYTFG
jgi:thiol-disulfide isomerase/thioredoxin